MHHEISVQRRYCVMMLVQETCLCLLPTGRFPGAPEFGGVCVSLSGGGGVCPGYRAANCFAADPDLPGILSVCERHPIVCVHVALASRCLQLVVYYIPIIRAHFETKLQPKQFNVLRHFDHITKDYNDHITEISAKLVAIMDSLFEKFLSKLSELHAKMFLVFPQYEVKAPMPSACFRNICKQMAKMHEAIFDLLPEEQTQVRLWKAQFSSILNVPPEFSCNRKMRFFFCTDAVSEDQCQF
ncbi:Vacuolar protein sorting-associated protein 54 [Xenoophorus captivus]|uniref:Vacuolar protein sorting-associated protein 54 n=1 Tax=Xenoophorus captivus TaxID=1517983 RepID=A0ABV0QWU5_9TELE